MTIQTRRPRLALSQLALCSFVMLALLFTLSTIAHADSDYDESTNGDLSGNRLAPSTMALTPGNNRLTATSIAGDIDYLAANIPNGYQLDAVMLSAFDSTDDKSFIAFQNGLTFTEVPTNADVAKLLGWSHFGAAPGEIDTDLLDAMAVPTNTIGFSQPLASGDYTFWMQETGSAPVTFTLDFMVSPSASITIYNEAADGDFSGDGLAPTVFPTGTLQVGGNVLSATSVSGDVEYFSFSVPQGMQLEAMLLKAYESAAGDNVAFAAVQSGSTFTEPTSGTEVANLLGYAHVGPGRGAIGSDFLDNMGAGSGAIGFTGALPSGDYTFWVQQTGGESTYSLEFVISEAPVLASQSTYVPVFMGTPRSGSTTIPLR